MTNGKNRKLVESVKAKIRELIRLIKKIKELKEKKSSQTTVHTYIVELRALVEDYARPQEDIIRHLAEMDKSDSNSQEAEKGYIFLEYIVLPVIRKALNDATEEFGSEFWEKIPLKIDGEFIKRVHEGSIIS